MSTDPKAGDVFTVAFPFVRDEYSYTDEEGYHTSTGWRPGVRFEDYGPEDVEAVADATGKMLLTVVDVVKPGRFPKRVFFTRAFVSPSGKTFGKPGLRITTLDAFRRRATGYMHPYRLAEALA